MIYLDNNATTRIDPRVFEIMVPYLTDQYANASSTHAFGVQVNEAVKLARQQVSDLIGCDTNELVFTSGATEAINLAIKGVAETYQTKGKHIVTVQTEHSAVLDVCKYLETKGYEVTYLPVQQDGLLDLNIVKEAIRKDTILVSVMYVNNETGVIQPIEQIASLAHEHGALFMTDATQAVGKLPINVKKTEIDLLTFSGHKFYGPKGIGGLYVRQRRPNKVKLSALQHGGGHERGFRSGTLNVPGIVGLGKAAEIAMAEMESDRNRITILRDQLENDLLAIPNTRLNGSREHRIYTTSNILFVGCDSDAMIMGLENIAVSNGSACTSTSIYPSHVLTAMGLNETEAFSSLRFSIGRFNNNSDVKVILKKVVEVISNLIRLSSI